MGIPLWMKKITDEEEIICFSNFAAHLYSAYTLYNFDIQILVDRKLVIFTRRS